MALTNAGVSAAPGFTASNFAKEETELRIQQLDVLATKYLCYEVPSFLEHVGGYVQSL